MALSAFSPLLRTVAEPANCGHVRNCGQVDKSNYSAQPSSQPFYQPPRHAPVANEEAAWLRWLCWSLRTHQLVVSCHLLSFSDLPLLLKNPLLSTCSTGGSFSFAVPHGLLVALARDCGLRCVALVRDCGLSCFVASPRLWTAASFFIFCVSPGIRFL